MIRSLIFYGVAIIAIVAFVNLYMIPAMLQ
jgi:hypothetical protein